MIVINGFVEIATLFGTFPADYGVPVSGWFQNTTRDRTSILFEWIKTCSSPSYPRTEFH
jgi:hypothetical protein